jgi:hypothetical protein
MDSEGKKESEIGDLEKSCLLLLLFCFMFSFACALIAGLELAAARSPTTSVASKGSKQAF